jgi:phosphoglucomutase
MIVGRRFFVTPSDSLAIIAAHANVIPFFREQGGLKAVARSMPTSGALDLVARKLGLDFFEVPTGWKFFGNLMDSKAIFNGRDYTPFICGEESFGTGSDHVREKDGMWAVLAWLSILAHYNTDASKPLVHVEEIVKKHWSEFGRNYYCRYDYEGVDKSRAEAMVAEMAANTASNTGHTVGSYTIAVADVFEYTDPVDGSVTKNQGIRFLMTDGSRIVFRLSGTAGSGATVRMYLEKFEPSTGNLFQQTGEAMKELVAVALELSQLERHTGRDQPTVIT